MTSPACCTRSASSSFPWPRRPQALDAAGRRRWRGDARSSCCQPWPWLCDGRGVVRRVTSGRGQSRPAAGAAPRPDWCAGGARRQQPSCHPPPTTQLVAAFGLRPSLAAGLHSAVCHGRQGTGPALPCAASAQPGSLRLASLASAWEPTMLFPRRVRDQCPFRLDFWDDARCCAAFGAPELDGLLALAGRDCPAQYPLIDGAGRQAGTQPQPATSHTGALPIQQPFPPSGTCRQAAERVTGDRCCTVLVPHPMFFGAHGCFGLWHVLQQQAHTTPVRLTVVTAIAIPMPRRCFMLGACVCMARRPDRRVLSWGCSRLLQPFTVLASKPCGFCRLLRTRGTYGACKLQMLGSVLVRSPPLPPAPHGGAGRMRTREPKP